MTNAATDPPPEIRIRMYNVGFGDCFLLTFYYSARKKKQMLIDFGSVRTPPNELQLLGGVARQIQAECRGSRKRGGSLDVLVATHRHAPAGIYLAGNVG